MYSFNNFSLAIDEFLDSFIIELSEERRDHFKSSVVYYALKQLEEEINEENYTKNSANRN